jgi:putative oxidoreductase
MAITHALARPLLAAMFVTGGVDALRNPESKVPTAEAVVPKVTDAVGVQADTETLVKVNGAVMTGAGVLLALGKLPRLAALALAGTLVPTTIAGHRFWEETDEKARKTQRIHFLKNVSMLGGLILAATDTNGRPSLGWRAKSAASKARESLPIAA